MRVVLLIFLVFFCIAYVLSCEISLSEGCVAHFFSHRIVLLFLFFFCIAYVLSCEISLSEGCVAHFFSFFLYSIRSIL